MKIESSEEHVPIIYALDPGVTSGYAIIDYSWVETDKGKDFEINHVVEMGVFSYPRDVLSQLSKARVADHIIIEDFILRKNLIGDKLLTVRVIGAFESFWPGRCVFQQPAEKIRASDGILKANSLWSNSPHTRDALRHALIFLYKARGRTEKLRAANLIRKRMQERYGN